MELFENIYQAIAPIIVCLCLINLIVSSIGKKRKNAIEARKKSKLECSETLFYRDLNSNIVYKLSLYRK